MKVRPLVISIVMVLLLVVGVLVAWFAFGLRPVLGLDLEGGIQIVLEAPGGTSEDVMNRALNNIRNRVDALGVGEPSLSVVGNQILVQVPSVAPGSVEKQGEEWCVTSGAGKDLGCLPTQEEAKAVLQQTGQDRLIQLIGTTARLEQREVLRELQPGDPEYEKLKVTCPTEAERLSAECTFEALEGEKVVFLGQDPDPNDGVDPLKYELGPVELTGDAIAKATATYISPGTAGLTAEPGWRIGFDLTKEGSDLFSAVTTRLAPEANNGVGKQLAIVVDQEVISAPTVQSEISGSGEITGGFSEGDAKDLATQLNAGALPVQLAQSNVETVSATLGQESLQQGLLAAAVGLGVLALYLLLYYRLLGLVTWAGMAIWSVLALGLVSLAGLWFGYALTLAGVAGLVVSLGITADSYIVFYERLKDDVRRGRSPRSAVQPAFRRAWHTIIAADVVTILAAAVLYVVAVSSVRGFALTLGLATTLDMFVVYFFKRPTVFLIARSDKLVNLPGMGLSSGVAADPLPAKAPAGAPSGGGR